MSARFSLSIEISRLTRDGTAEHVPRDQILRRERGQGDIHFPCSADHEQDWQPYPVDPCSAICVTIHTYIHIPWRFFSGVTFVLFCFVFRLYAFVEAAALRVIVLQYAGVPIATLVSFFLFFFLYFFLFIWRRCRFVRVFFPLSLCMESTSYVLSFRMVFFLSCDHGLDFLHQLMTSINQSINTYA